MWTAKNQGTTQHEKAFGYVGESGDNGGGYFFTWHPTLAETIDSITEDEIDRPRRLRRETAERAVRRMWREEAQKEWNSLIPVEKGKSDGA